MIERYIDWQRRDIDELIDIYVDKIHLCMPTKKTVEKYESVFDCEILSVR